MATITPVQMWNILAPHCACCRFPIQDNWFSQTDWRNLHSAQAARPLFRFSCHEKKYIAHLSAEALLRNRKLYAILTAQIWIIFA